jgi:hypothetical protein
MCYMMMIYLYIYTIKNFAACVLLFAVNASCPLVLPTIMFQLRVDFTAYANIILGPR